MKSVSGRLCAGSCCLINRLTKIISHPFMASLSSAVRPAARRCQCEVLEPRAMLAGEGLLITEFMASNTTTLNDEDGDSSDWIEIYNPTAGAVTLDGAYLTDNVFNLTRWQFPDPTGGDDVVLNAGEYLLVFASGKNKTVVGSELHTNFQLQQSGEYLALVADDGSTIVHAYTPSFPDQKKNVSYGLDYVGSTTPTDVIPVNDPDDDVWITDDGPLSPHNNDYVSVWSSDFGDERYGIVQFDLSGLDLGSPETTLQATGDTWVRESSPNNTWNLDGMSVWNSDSTDGARRWGIVEFDVSGYSINSLELDLWAQAFGFSDDNIPLKQTAAIIDTGATITESLTWNAVASLPQIPLETLGKYDIPAAKIAIPMPLSLR